jgi:hypothetical protein
MGDEQVAATRSRVDAFLQASFGRVLVDEEGDFTVQRGGVPAFVQLFWLAGRHTVVLVWSVSNFDVSIDSDLTEFLATETNNLAFGQFQLYEDDARIHISHALLGEFLRRQELDVAVDAVIEATGHYGRVVRERFGGRLGFEPHAGVAHSPDPGSREEVSNPEDVESQRLLLELGLRDMVPGVSVDEAGDFVLPHPSGVIWVRVLPWTEGRILARVWSITNVGMRVDGDLARYLLTKNAMILLSGFRLDPATPAVMLVHYLLGNPVNLHELVTATAHIAADTSRYAPEIKARFGGKLFVET